MCFAGAGESASMKYMLIVAILLVAAGGYYFYTTPERAGYSAPEQAGTTEPAITRGELASSLSDQTVLVEFQSEFGPLRVELYPERAPRTVADLLKLVESNYYATDAVMESRPGLGFVIFKLGDSYKTLEFEDEETNLASERGSVAVSRKKVSGAYLNNIFVGFKAQPELEKHYIIIGRVIAGLEGYEKAGATERYAISGASRIEKNHAGLRHPQQENL
jgi:cyclophilin family peptidyl-prolyl cis-trans isomerase